MFERLSSVSFVLLLLVGMGLSVDAAAAESPSPSLSMRQRTMLQPAALLQSQRDPPSWHVPPIGAGVFLAGKTLRAPAGMGFALADGAALWLGAGASAALSLLSHTVVGGPVTLFTGIAFMSILATNPALAFVLAAGVAGGYVLVHGAITGLLSGLVFNVVSDIYDANVLSSVMGHIAGDALALTVGVSMFGAGALTLHGMLGLVAFTGGAGVVTTEVLTVLLGLSAFALTGVALIVLPAALGMWAMTTAMTPQAGYAEAPDWRNTTFTDVAPRITADQRQVLPLLNVAF